MTDIELQLTQLREANRQLEIDRARWMARWEDAVDKLQPLMDTITKIEKQRDEFVEKLRQERIEKDDYKAVVVAREAGFIIEQMGGFWWWKYPNGVSVGPFPHQFAAARDAVGEVKGQAAGKAGEYLKGSEG